MRHLDLLQTKNPRQKSPRRGFLSLGSPGRCCSPAFQNAQGYVRLSLPWGCSRHSAATAVAVMTMHGRTACAPHICFPGLWLNTNMAVKLSFLLNTIDPTSPLWLYWARASEPAL